MFNRLNKFAQVQYLGVQRTIGQGCSAYKKWLHYHLFEILFISISISLISSIEGSKEFHE